LVPQGIANPLRAEAESVDKVLPAGESVVENLPRHVPGGLEKGGARSVCPASESGKVVLIGFIAFFSHFQCQTMARFLKMVHITC